MTFRQAAAGLLAGSLMLTGGMMLTGCSRTAGNATGNVSGDISGNTTRSTSGNASGNTSAGEADTAAQRSDQTRLTIGFAQVGEESDWRRANSVSIEETFSTENGYRLLFDDAQNNQDKQIRAIRNFIQQEVDYIILEPIVETGWDTVLREAKEAGIPVIVADRKIDVEDDDLYLTWIGSDTLLEGQKVCTWFHEWLISEQIDESSLNIVNIQGTLGSAPQIERDLALTQACETYGWKLIAQERGEFTQAKGREAMAALLEAYPDLNVVYCDNDNEAYGAIEALEEAGKVPGFDIENGEILILSFDSAQKGLRYVLEGKILCDGECNPDHGPRIEAAILQAEAGEVPAKIQYVDEEIFVASDVVSSISVDGTQYPVIVVDQEVVDTRAY